MFSLPKILLFVVVGIAIWLLWRMLQRRGVSGIFRQGKTQGTTQGTQQDPKALEMEKCRICGDFVSADARACANTRCPYPGR